MHFPSGGRKAEAWRDDARRCASCHLPDFEMLFTYPGPWFFSGADKRECYLGEEAVAKRGVLTLSYPACISAMNRVIDRFFLSVLDSSLLPTARQLAVNEGFFLQLVKLDTRTHTHNDLSESVAFNLCINPWALGPALALLSK